jgi:hypothetical protein
MLCRDPSSVARSDAMARDRVFVVALLLALDELAAELASGAEDAQTSTKAAGPASLLAGGSGRVHGRCGDLRPGLGAGHRIGFLNAYEVFLRRERGAQ